MTLRILGGTLKGRRLKTPKHSFTRPTQGILREAVFNVCQNRLVNAHFLDLFAGSGSMGLEALSRGAKLAVLVEKDKKAVQCIRENIQQLHLEHCTQIFATDIQKALPKISQRNLQFDLIYIDPPYGSSSVLLSEIFVFLETYSLLRTKALVFIEESREQIPLQCNAKNLILKKTRCFGIAQLYQFEYTPESL